MIKDKKISDDDLKNVNGGSIVTLPDCSNFFLSSSRDMSSLIKENRMDWTYDCRDCVYWKGPEGPCILCLDNEYTNM